MKSVTVEQVIAWKPCGLHEDDDGVNYTPQRIKHLFAGHESLTARDGVQLYHDGKISAEDCVWYLLHNEFLSDRQMHLLACDFAEAVVHLCGDDPRPQAAIDAKRAWVDGKICDDELAAAYAAARAAAYAAAGDVARATAWAAALAAARVTARAVARATAGVAAHAYAADWAAARAAQIKAILAMVD